MLTLYPTHALQRSLAFVGHSSATLSQLMEVHLPPTAPPSPTSSNTYESLAQTKAVTAPFGPLHHADNTINSSSNSLRTRPPPPQATTTTASLPFAPTTGINTPSEDASASLSASSSKLAMGGADELGAALITGDDEQDAFFPAHGHSPIYLGSTTSQLRTVLDAIDVDECDVNGENAFFIANLSEVYRQHVRWVKALPRVKPFYAVKCNPDPYVLRLLSALGCGFDCASNGEIQAVLDLGVSPERIIYANPCKAASFVRQARLQQVHLTTFDNMDELAKMKRFHPDCKLVVRILTDDSKSVCQLGLKFGAPLDSVPRLLARARQLDLDVVGVSFHVGSGCYDAGAFADAISRAKRAFEMGAEAGYEFHLLDVGGGYAHDNFDQIATVLSAAIEQHFPASEFGAENTARRRPLDIIAEPGRYFVQRAFVLATNIIARRDGRQAAEDDHDVNDEGHDLGEVDAPGGEADAPADIDADGEQKPKVMYYQNDGVYASFNCILFDHAVVHPRVLTLKRRFVYDESLPAPGVPPLPIPPDAADGTAKEGKEEEEGQGKEDGDDPLRLQPCSVWGPTCDSIDCVKELAFLPQGLEVGDWLVYSDMGGYTLCAASSFNGLRPSEVRYTCGGEGEVGAREVRELLLHDSVP